MSRFPLRTERHADRPRVESHLSRAAPAGDREQLRTDRGLPGHVLGVQRQAGNRAATLLIQRSRADGAEPTVDADSAAQGIITWIRKQAPDGQQVNYCVGVATSGDLIISKVNGVTAATSYVKDLGAYIKSEGYEIGRDIKLAQKFNTAVGSNHAEMCIMAAAGQGQVTKIYCSGPHCAFCAAVMAQDKVQLGAATGADSQQGWTHPFAPLGYGSQLRAGTSDQLAELQGLKTLYPTKEQIKVGQWLTSSPTGKLTAWL